LSRISAIRFDGESIYHGVTFRAERRLANNFAYNVSYTLSHSKDDASSPGATESETNLPQNVDNIFDETGEWALSSFDHRHQFIASGSLQFPFFSGAGGVAEALLGGWRANVIFIAQAGAPFTVNLSVDRANIGPGALVRYIGVCAAGRVHVRERTAKQRHRTGLRERRLLARENMDAPARLDARVPVGDLQPAEPGKLRSPEPDLRQPEFRPHLQREEPARDAVRPPPRVLAGLRTQFDTGVPGCLIRAGQVQGECAPASGFAGHGELPFHGFGHSSGQREPQSRAVDLRSRHGRAAIEGFEDTRKIAVVDPNPSIRDADLDFFPQQPLIDRYRANAEPALLAAVLQRVGDEVLQQL
jgi:hypothetical protein